MEELAIFMQKVEHVIIFACKKATQTSNLLYLQSSSKSDPCLLTRHGAFSLQMVGLTLTRTSTILCRSLIFLLTLTLTLTLSGFSFKVMY